MQVVTFCGGLKHLKAMVMSLSVLHYSVWNARDMRFFCQRRLWYEWERKRYSHHGGAQDSAGPNTEGQN